MSDHSFDILLVEDNPADADLTREGLQDGRLLHTLHHEIGRAHV